MRFSGTPLLKKALLPIALIFLTLGSISQAQAKHLLVFGDSLSAAYGMDWQQGWAQLLNQYWANNPKGQEHKVSNASISGETTVGGLDRLPLTLSELKPDVVMIELGANDGLRGYPIKKIKENLIAMAEMVEASGAKVIIAGISLPPSYGPRYIDQFRQMFRDVAAQSNRPYIDMFDESFLERDGYIQADGLHPTAITQPLIRDSILTFLEEQELFK